MKLFQLIEKRVWHFLGNVQEPFYSWLNKCMNFWLLMKNREKIRHFPEGEHKDKIFYLIDDLPYSVGLAGWYDRVLGYMKRAEAKGWIPIVAKSHDSAFKERGDWYTYFSAVSRYSHLDINEFANVVKAEGHGVIHKRYNPKEIAIRHRLSANAKLNEETSDFVEQILSKFNCNETKSIGVYFRGTDYRVGKSWRPIGHTTVPAYEDFAMELEQTAEKWGVDLKNGSSIFFVTEEEEALEFFKNRWPNIRYIKKARFKNFRFGVCVPHQVPDGVAHIDNNRLYLADIVGLSRCNYLFGGVNGGVLMALNLNGNKYQGVNIINTGVS